MTNQKSFYANTIAQALQDCREEGYQPLFMPELIEERIKEYEAGNTQANVLIKWYTTISSIITGKTEQGSKVVLFDHSPNYFSNLRNLRASIKRGLKNGAGTLPQKSFQKKVDLAGNGKIFLLDYDILKNSKSGVISVEQASEHPMTIPFLGLPEEEAEKYLLDIHKKIYGSKIGIWHPDDLNEEPVGRLLFLGYYYNSGFIGYDHLDYLGRFFGVQNKVAEGDEKILKAPTLDEILTASERFVSEFAKDQFKEAISKLYK